MLNSLIKKKAESDNSEQQTRMARRYDRYHREMYNLNKRMVEQNDIIIALLKEIRDSKVR